MELPFVLETELERKIAADPVWREGIVWGKPRSGHQEGAVMYHIAEILRNIEGQNVGGEEREKLRLIALVHDTLKYQVNESRPRVGTNNHAYLARRFAERYISDPVLLDIIELHDEAFNSWRMGFYKRRWEQAEERVERLVQRLGSALALYVRFFCADSLTESKDRTPVDWFEEYLQRHDYHIPFC